MKTYDKVMVALFTALIVTGLSGCEREGPAERAGKAVDEAVEDAGEAIEDAQEEVEDAIEEEKETRRTQ